jgi:release factor glutamine methyltransferase
VSSAQTVEALLAASGLAPREARALLAHVLGVARERLVAHPEESVAVDKKAAFRAAADRRRAGEPLAYLLGVKEFCGRCFAVNRDVLIPRPETEALVELALHYLRALTAPRVLDLGTGSGCIAITLSLEHPDAEVTATDLSASALAIAAANAQAMSARAIDFRLGSWYEAVPPGARYDLIISNPPYVARHDPHLAELAFEPAVALTDGGDGLRCLAAVIAGAKTAIAAGGWLALEHGYDQHEAVQQMLREHGWRPLTYTDCNGHPRATVARRDGPDNA